MHEGLAIRQQLARLDPENAGWQRLAMLYVKVADALTVQGNKTEALASYNDALAVLQRLSTDHPGNSRWQRDFGGVQEKITGLRR